MKNLNLSMAVLALPALVAIFLIVNNLQSPAALMGALAATVAALIAGGEFLAMRRIKKVKTESLDEGITLIMETVPVACSLFDKDSNPVYCNDKALSLYGFNDRQDFSRRYASTLPELQPDGSRSADMMAKFIKNVIDKGTGTLEWHQKTAAGELFPLRVEGVKAYFHGEQHVLEYDYDLREERKIQRKEALFKERTQAILDALPMLCAIYDEHGNAQEVNKEAENMFGISDKRIFATQFSKFLPPRQPDGSDSMRKNVEMMKQTIRDGHSRYEWMYKHRDGTPLPTEEIMQHVKIDGESLVIAYSRDLREFYASKEAERVAQKRVNEMMERLNNQLETQASAITESSAAIEEMIANIRSVSNTLSKNSENVKDLQSASEVGHSGLVEVATDIREIAQESESLLEINAVMQNIASQTNLLSMNAAIEAAHAGESGRGFAVVADEIRKLAESSSQQSKTISTVLKKIKGSIDKITRSTDNVMDRFTAIDGGVKTVAEQEQGIMNAMTEQGAGSTQIMQAIAQVNDITHQVKSDAQQMVEAAAKLGV